MVRIDPRPDPPHPVPGCCAVRKFVDVPFQMMVTDLVKRTVAPTFELLPKTRQANLRFSEPVERRSQTSSAGSHFVPKLHSPDGRRLTQEEAKSPCLTVPIGWNKKNR